MKCYCYETETEFVFCVENADAELEKNLEAAWFHKVDDKFLKTYPNTINDKELIAKNFSRLGESMFRDKGDWEKTFKKFAAKYYEKNIVNM
ncbi:hypothetical protein [Thermoanaerobacter pentosaceus]|uniref:Uncharacterized protein n=1 Tax=Thermoanaerobacter pentosaceus TaxID=694059 RepID=A0ABT9M6J0_9THEO|nr:hypothetical protein [Thermoanaerobacter pentosaceus]MDP9751753.1 hypothetical protein [Thermoanaerobacter pentosaceus]